MEQVCIGNRYDLTTGMNDTDCNHGDNNSRDDTDECYIQLVRVREIDFKKDSDIQTRESQDIFSKVRGKQRMHEMTIPMTPHTIEQTTWLVIVFMATVKVKR